MEFNGIQKRIIQNGVKNVHEFGYTAATEKNILTDFMYSQVFESMLKDNLGHGFDEDINELLEYIKENRKEFGSL